jgi:alginate O-acetyltransferase complex protein AlgI
MLFNSFEFIVFILVFFTLFWTISTFGNITFRNIFILGASYIFYGWWDWRYLILIILSSFLDFYIGNKIESAIAKKRKQLLLAISLSFNLGLLMYFKYVNFFIDNFIEIIETLGFQANISSLEIILPVGISFYTFQTLSYSIDIYRGKMKPSKNLIAFLSYVAFFPQLVAGPIERAVNLLPQFYTKKVFSYSEARSGMQQILWGLFKKVVIADNCAPIVNSIFAQYEILSSGTLVFGAILFAFQIYGDFSGYSDMAIGIAKLFNFKLHSNFKTPYFSRDMAEFWRRWHISLSTWFRDYLYIPLGGSKGGKWMKIRNTFIIFIVSGFWHGANWTFIFWGALNALFFLPLLLTNSNRKNLENVAQNSLLPSIKETLQMIFTFALTVFAWIFFRAKDFNEALNYIKGIFDFSGSNIDFELVYTITVVIPIIIMLLFEWKNRKHDFGFHFDQQSLSIARWSSYVGIFLIIVFVGSFEKAAFIYFQF